MGNILVSPLPDAVQVGETSVPINTSHRIGIQVMRTADRDLPPSVLAGLVLSLYFGEHVPDPSAAFEAAMRFHRADAEPAERAESRRLLSFDDDAGRILGDFRRYFAVDLADPALRMHWWVFLALFSALPDDAATSVAMRYRGPTPKGLSRDEKREWQRVAAHYALAPRTRAEEIEAIEAAWE